MVPVELRPMVFVPIALMTRRDVREWRKRRYAVAFGDLRKHRQSNRSINGWPMFFEFEMLSKA